MGKLRGWLGRKYRATDLLATMSVAHTVPAGTASLVLRSYALSLSLAFTVNSTIAYGEVHGKSESRI